METSNQNLGTQSMGKLMKQYAQIPMAIVGIVMKFLQIVISIVVGMAAGCIPLLALTWAQETSSG